MVGLDVGGPIDGLTGGPIVPLFPIRALVCKPDGGPLLIGGPGGIPLIGGLEIKGLPLDRPV